MYATGAVAARFGVGPQTVRNWSDRFGEFLGAGAVVSGSARTFTDSDLEVLALVSELTGTGLTYAQVATSLGQGKRGRVPDAPVIDSDVVAVMTPDEIGRTLEIMHVRDQALGEVKALEKQVARDEEIIKSKDVEINRLNRTLGAAEGEIARLKADRGKGSLT